MARTAQEVTERELAVLQALWDGGNDYMILHNVACIYAVLSRAEPAQARPHQDVALRLLRRAVDHCHHVGDGEKEVWNIQGDQLLVEALSSREEFKKLFAEERP